MGGEGRKNKSSVSKGPYALYSKCPSGQVPVCGPLAGKPKERTGRTGEGGHTGAAVKRE